MKKIEIKKRFFLREIFVPLLFIIVCSVIGMMMIREKEYIFAGISFLVACLNCKTLFFGCLYFKFIKVVNKFVDYEEE